MVQPEIMAKLVVKTELQRLLGVTYQDVDVALCTMAPMYKHNTYFYDRCRAIVAMRKYYLTQIAYFQRLKEASNGSKYYSKRIETYTKRLDSVERLMCEWGIGDGSPNDH